VPARAAARGHALRRQGVFPAGPGARHRPAAERRVQPARQVPAALDVHALGMAHRTKALDTRISADAAEGRSSCATCIREWLMPTLPEVVMRSTCAQAASSGPK
jgi:hypothetical protein